METLWNCLFSSKICYFSSLCPVKSVPLISSYIFAVYTRQNFHSMTAFQIKLLSFQGKCNKCLNRSEFKIMRGKGGKKANLLLLSYKRCFLSASSFGDTFIPGSWKDCSQTKKSQENVEVSWAWGHWRVLTDAGWRERKVESEWEGFVASSDVVACEPVVPC